MSILPINEAKDRLTRIVRQAEGGERIQLTRHGKAAAVIVGAEDFARLSASGSRLLDAIADWRASWRIGDPAFAEEDETDAFAGLRDVDPGLVSEATP